MLNQLSHLGTPRILFPFHGGITEFSWAGVCFLSLASLSKQKVSCFSTKEDTNGGSFFRLSPLCFFLYKDFILFYLFIYLREGAQVGVEGQRERERQIPC